MVPTSRRKRSTRCLGASGLSACSRLRRASVQRRNPAAMRAFAAEARSRRTELDKNMRFAVLLLLIAAIGPHSSPQAPQADGCAVSAMIRDAAPPDPNADRAGPANWYINGNRTIWAGPVPEAGWPSGGTLFAGGRTVRGQKT